MFTLPHPRITIAATLAAAAVAGGLTLAGSVATAPAADAAVPIVKKGDILLPTHGTLFNGGGIDKLDPATRVRSRAASFGVNDGTDQVAAAPNGDFFAANQDGRVVKVDGVTGSQTTIKFPFSQNGVALDDLAVGADGKLIGLLNEETGHSLVRFEGQNGLTVLSEDGLLAQPDELAIEHDGRVLVTDGNRVLRINPATGAQSTVGAFATTVGGLAVRSDGQIFVRTSATETIPERLMRLDPITGAGTQVCQCWVLRRPDRQRRAWRSRTVRTWSRPKAASSVPGAWCGSTRSPGNQDRLIQLGEFENLNIAVAGVSQIPPTPLPVAGNDTFTLTPESGSSGELHVLAPGLLGNDSDPLKQSLSAEVVGSSQLPHGFISFFGDGSFFYFPNSGFVGTETFTYRAVAADGRRSAPATVTVNVRAVADAGGQGRLLQRPGDGHVHAVHVQRAERAGQRHRPPRRRAGRQDPHPAEHGAGRPQRRRHPGPDHPARLLRAGLVHLPGQRRTEQVHRHRDAADHPAGGQHPTGHPGQHGWVDQRHRPGRHDEPAGGRRPNRLECAGAVGDLVQPGAGAGGQRDVRRRRQLPGR